MLALSPHSEKVLVQTPAGTFSVCMFILGFSSHSPTTCFITGESKLSLGVAVGVRACVGLQWTGDPHLCQQRLDYAPGWMDGWMDISFRV